MSKLHNFSRIIAGTMTWGSWGKQLTEKEMAALMVYAKDLGISTFDHADIYGDYGTEEAFGKAFVASGLKREHIQLISKCGIQMIRGRNNAVGHYQYDAAYIVAAVERSLRKLQTDYLDLLLLHRPSPLMRPEEVAKAIGQLKAAGKIKQFGVSNFTPSQVALIAQETPVMANQVAFSLTHVNPMEDGTFDDCMIHKRLAMAWSPLGSYYKEEGPKQQRIAAVLAPMAQKYGVDPSQLLLAFILKHPAGVYPVIGTTNKERLVAAVEAIELQLDLQDWFILLEAAKGAPAP